MNSIEEPIKYVPREARKFATRKQVLQDSFRAEVVKRFERCATLSSSRPYEHASTVPLLQPTSSGTTRPEVPCQPSAEKNLEKKEKDADENARAKKKRRLQFSKLHAERDALLEVDPISKKILRFQRQLRK